MLNHLLVPLDGSELARTALPYAKAILAPNGRITLVSVIQPPETPIYDFYPAPMPHSNTYATDINTIIHYAQDYLEHIADELRDEGFSRVHVRVETGDPAAEIVAVAEQVQADAIVISTHGRSGFSRWLFGSVTQKVMTIAPCPIMVIPGKNPVLLPATASTTEAALPTISNN